MRELFHEFLLFPVFLLAAISDINGPVWLLLESAGDAKLYITLWLVA